MAPIPYIRFRDPDDLGLRPPDAYIFATPAISILKPSSAPKPDPDIVYADLPGQFVKVEVGNKGSTDANAFVTVWAAGFGTSTAQSGYAASLGGVEGNTKAITIPAGASGSATSVSFPWMPQGGEIGAGPELHCCVQANVYVDPADEEPDPNLPPTTPPTPPTITPFTEIRHAQRNMTLLPKPPGVQEMMFELVIANPDPKEDAEFTFEVVEIHGRFDRNEIAHLRQTRWVDHRHEKLLALPGHKGGKGEGEHKLKPAPKQARDIKLHVGKKSDKKVDVHLERGEQGSATLGMTFERGHVAEVHRFEIVQLRGRELIGGAKVMTVTVPDELLEQGS